MQSMPKSRGYERQVLLRYDANVREKEGTM